MKKKSFIGFNIGRMKFGHYLERKKERKDQNCVTRNAGLSNKTVKTRNWIQNNFFEL